MKRYPTKGWELTPARTTSGDEMAEQERKLEHGLQVMLDLLTDYLGNAATRTEWVVEIQERFTSRKKLRRGWSDDRIDVRIRKLEQMGLITGGRGFGQYYSAVIPMQPRTEQTRPNSLLGFARGAYDTEPAFTSLFAFCGPDVAEFRGDDFSWMAKLPRLSI
jgi:hypothetical protein